MKRKNIVLCVISLLFASYVFAQQIDDKLAVQDYSKFKEEWPNTDFSKSALEVERIIDGGPAKDGIPSIDKPTFRTANNLVDYEDSIYIPEHEPVIAIYLNGEARAYPLRFLIWHEIVNDKVGDTPIAVTFCPLCNSSIVYERAINGEEVEFGVTGKLYNSDMLMYDRKTESWWQQYTGEAVVGEMLGTKLKRVVSRVESFETYKKRHPKGKVLIQEEYIRNYGSTPYPHYDRAVIPFLYDGEYKGKLPPMTYLVVVGDEAWPLSLLSKYRRIKHDDIVLIWSPLQNSVLDNFDIKLSRDVGNVMAIRKTEDGVFKDTNYNVTFAFVFDAFHPDGKIYYDIKKDEVLESEKGEN